MSSYQHKGGKRSRKQSSKKSIRRSSRKSIRRSSKRKVTRSKRRSKGSRKRKRSKRKMEGGVDHHKRCNDHEIKEDCEDAYRCNWDDTKSPNCYFE